MAKGKGKGKTITLKMALNCIKLTLDDKRCLDLSFKELATVPKCIEKMCNVEELNLSRNLLKKIPDFINQFTTIRTLDLHSNYVSTARCDTVRYDAVHFIVPVRHTFLRPTKESVNATETNTIHMYAGAHTRAKHQNMLHIIHVTQINIRHNTIREG